MFPSKPVDKHPEKGEKKSILRPGMTNREEVELAGRKRL